MVDKKLHEGVTDKDLLQFFQDIEFMAPNNRDPREFIDTGDQDVDIEVSEEAVDDMSGEDMWGDIENKDHSDHPDPQTYADYYMFTDPAVQKGVGEHPVSDKANSLDKVYTQKDLSDLQSVSDAHYESLEQEPDAFPKHQQQEIPRPPEPVDDSFPRHVGSKSMMEPTVIPQPRQNTLQRETYIEGQLYPKGSKITVVNYGGKE